MRIAIRTLIVACTVAAILWTLAFFPGLILRSGDLGTGVIFVMAFGYGHILLAALFLISVVVTTFALFRAPAARSAKSYFVFSFSLVSFVVSSWFCYFFFYG